MRTIEAWFDALYLEHAPKMRKLTARTLDDAAIAEDLVHNVFILLLWTIVNKVDKQNY